MAKTKATEGEFRGQVIGWLKEQIAHGGLPFENVTIDSRLYGLPTARFPDVLLTLDFECLRPFCGWELKTPKTSVRDKTLLKDAVEKAQTLDAKYFVTWNMQTAIIWRTPPKIRKSVKEKDNIREFGPDARIQCVDDIRDFQKSLLMQSTCVQLLRDLARLYNDENINLPVADTTFFVNMVGNTSNIMAETIFGDIKKARASRDFDKRLNAWAKKQGVSKYDQDYYHTLSQQIAYKIIGKILFYMTLRRHKLDLPRMELPAKSYKTATKRMRELFQRALEVDYQAIFESDITDEIGLSADTTREIINLTENLSHWSFDLMPLDVVGNVFEKLIPQEARHSLGQYFTPENLVDLIVSFCVRNGEDYVMDPTCGTGTFLIRSYNRLRYLRHRKHRELLEKIWGFDIARFPAELATINLYRQDFSDYLNFPRILSKDFFEVLTGDIFEFPPPKKTLKAGERIKVQIPKFDALVGNFPFIRQELIEKAEKGYKKKLESILFESWGKEYTALFRDGNSKGHKLALSGQADIYAYLFFHTASHIKEGGRMGFVTSNSWLDVAYGYELQRFFLSKFKIIAICESRCEPWFEQSAVNTVFTIIERCKNEQERKVNEVCFLKIKKPLAQLFPQDALTDSQSRWNNLDAFVEKIEELPLKYKAIKSKEFRKFESFDTEYIKQPEIISYEDEKVRARLIKQEQLKEEVETAGQTVKWGRYLRAPDVYFEILEKCADKFVPLSEVAELRRGITTGINEFFYLTEDDIKYWGIEKEFLKPVIKSPKESDSIKLKKRNLNSYAFLCHREKSELKGKKALKYIQWGERNSTGNKKPWPEVASVKGRRNWYELPKRSPSLLLLPMITGSSLRCILNSCKAQVDHNLFEVISTDEKVIDALSVYLNSGTSFLSRELIGRANLGDGALKVEGIDWKRMPVPEKKSLIKLKKDTRKDFENLCSRKIKGIKTEAKRKDRIAFEKAVLKSLGLDVGLAEKILEAVVGLVEERHLLPKLRSSKKKKRFNQDLEKLREEVSEDILGDGVRKFPDGFIKSWSKVKCKEITVLAGSLKLGDSFFDKQEILNEQGQHVMELGSEERGKFVVYAKKKDEFVIKVPESMVIIKKAIQEYEAYVRKIKESLFRAFMERCGDRSVSENITRQVIKEYNLPDI